MGSFCLLVSFFTICKGTSTYKVNYGDQSGQGNNNCLSPPGGGGGWGSTWVNFCWVYATGFSEPLPRYGPFCGQL